MAMSTPQWELYAAVEQTRLLLSSAGSGNAAGVRFAFRPPYPCADARRHDGATPLTIASENGFSEIVEDLLARGANINEADGRGWPPLAFAAAAGQGAVHVLLDHGADVHWADGQGRTALFLAAERGRVGVITALLERGANINQVECQGWTPLYAASLYGHLDTVKSLLEAGADPFLAAKDGMYRFGKLPVDAVCKGMIGGDRSTNNRAITALLKAAATGSRAHPIDHVNHKAKGGHAISTLMTEAASCHKALAATWLFRRWVPRIKTRRIKAPRVKTSPLPAPGRYTPIRTLGSGAFGTAALATPSSATAAALRLPPDTPIVIKTSHLPVDHPDMRIAMREVEVLAKASATVPRCTASTLTTTHPTPHRRAGGPPPAHRALPGALGRHRQAPAHRDGVRGGR